MFSGYGRLYLYGGGFRCTVLVDGGGFGCLVVLGDYVFNTGEKKVVLYWFCNFRAYSGLVFCSELWYKYKFINS